MYLKNKIFYLKHGTSVQVGKLLLVLSEYTYRGEKSKTYIIVEPIGSLLHSYSKNYFLKLILKLLGSINNYFRKNLCTLTQK